MPGPKLLALVTALATALLSGHDRVDAGRPQAPRARGVKVTFERAGKRDAQHAPHGQRARLLSLAVERGETPTPFLPPGAFRATFEATLLLPARDRVRFRIDGRGKAKLKVNGDVVLDGALRGNQALETAAAVRMKKGDNALELEFDSAPMGDGQVRLFWSGADFGFEPIAPELLSFPADDAAVQRGEQLRIGQQLFTERRCARCHEFAQLRVGESAFGELDSAGPDLRQAGARLQPAWIAAWLADPRAFRPNPTMPRFALSDQEAADVAVWLGGLGAASPAADVLDPQLVDAGRRRFRQLGCVACHAAPGEAAADAALGDRIPLAFVARKWRPLALVAFLQEPARHHPAVRMPDLRLSLDDARALASWLLSAPGEALPEPTGDADRGRRTAQRLGCAICHALDVPLGDRLWKLLDTLKPERGCLAERPGEHGAPDHGFTEEQREALRAFLPHAETAPFRRSPLDFATRHVAAERCTACHALDGEPSVWARRVERRRAVEPVPVDEDPVAQGVPSLTWTGAKLQPSWLEGFATGKVPSPRPWLTARMPTFARHGATIVAGLVREHGYGAQDEPNPPGAAQLAVHGERLVAQGTGFGCVQCHALGDQPPVQVFEREGINLLTAYGRLRHEYFTRWLADPPRLDPESRMPKYADAKGRTALTDVLGGDAAQQFEAIWQFLGSRQPARR